MSDAPKHRIPINPMAWEADEPLAEEVAAKAHEGAQGEDTPPTALNTQLGTGRTVGG